MVGYMNAHKTYVEEFADNVDDTLYEVRLWDEHQYFLCDVYWKQSLFTSKVAIALFGGKYESKRHGLLNPDGN
ncbi:MAG: hypothetical protein ACOYOV_00170 [Bacteroidales bacterium]